MSTPRTAPARLLFVLPDLKGGGVPRVTLALLGALDPQRYALSLLNLGTCGSASAGSLERQLPPHVKLLRGWPGGLLGARLATQHHARTHDLLIAAQETRATFCVHEAMHRLHKPAIAWVHLPIALWAQGYTPRHRRRAHAAYRAIAQQVFVSAGARASMREFLGQLGAHATVIPNLFREDNYAEPSAAERAWLARLQSRRYVLGVGRLEPRKGFERLLRAFALIRGQHRDTDLVLLGDGPERARLSRLAGELGIGAHLHLPGHVASALPWLRQASAYALSSRLEGLPTTILEAFAAGCPVAAFDCPTGPAELLDGGRAGVLVRDGDVQALAAALGRLLASPTLAQAYASAASERLALYRAPAVVPRWEALIDATLASA